MSLTSVNRFVLEANTGGLFSFGKAPQPGCIIMSKISEIGIPSPDLYALQ